MVVMDEELHKKINGFKERDLEFIKMIHDNGLPDWPNVIGPNFPGILLEKVKKIVLDKKKEEGLLYFDSIIYDSSRYTDGKLYITNIEIIYKAALITLNIEF
jgi:hypothetical protein